MLTGLTILIAEDQALLALDLADAIEEQGGRILGPVATVAAGLALAEQGVAVAAILDANLLDGHVTPLALRLIEKKIPFVLHTGTGLPDDLARVYPGLTVVMKPVPPAIVLEALNQELYRNAAGETPARPEIMQLDNIGRGAGTTD